LAQAVPHTGAESKVFLVLFLQKKNCFLLLRRFSQALQLQILIHLHRRIPAITDRPHHQ
jgi:hypothetical protein